jgi:hypothetical protein
MAERLFVAVNGLTRIYQSIGGTYDRHCPDLYRSDERTTGYTLFARPRFGLFYNSANSRVV